MSEERKKVLELLAQGKITPDDAEKLLDKLGAAVAGSSDSKSQAREDAASRKHRFLRIQVDRPDRDQVNIRVPLAFMRAGMNLMAVIPPRVSEGLIARGIDLSALTSLCGEELPKALQELNLDVDGPDGKKVRIFCE